MKYIKGLVAISIVVLLVGRLAYAQIQPKYSIVPQQARVRQSVDLPITVDYQRSTQSARAEGITLSWGHGILAGTQQYIDDLLGYVDYGVMQAERPPIVNMSDNTVEWLLGETASPSGTLQAVFHTRPGFYDDADVVYTLTAGASGQLNSTASARAQSKITYHVENSSEQSRSIFSDVRMTRVGTTSATLHYHVNQASITRLIYGLAPQLLTSSVNMASISAEQYATMSPLLTNTRYYVQIATSSRNKTVLSSIYTFKTSTQANISHPTYTSSHIYASNGLDQTFTSGQVNILTGHTYLVELPHQSPGLAARVYVTSPSDSVQLVTRMKTPNDQRTLYAYHAPAKPGDYNLTVDVISGRSRTDEYKIGTLHVTDPITVVSGNARIVDARVSIQHSQSVAPTQTEYTTRSGAVSLELPPGEYRLTVRAPGYATVDTMATIVSGGEYPRIELTKDAFNITGWLTYQQLISHEATIGAPSPVWIIGVVNTYGYPVTTLLIALLYVSYVAWVGIPVMSIARFIMHQIHRRRHPASYHRLIAEVTQSNSPVVAVRVYLVDPRYGRVVDHAYTDHRGVFRFDALTAIQYMVVVMIPDTQPYVVHLADVELSGSGRYHVTLPTSLKSSSHHHALRVWLAHSIARLYSLVMVMAFVGAILTSVVLGVLYGAPLILLWTANILLYVVTTMTLPSEWFTT